MPHATPHKWSGHPQRRRIVTNFRPEDGYERLLHITPMQHLKWLIIPHVAMYSPTQCQRKCRNDEEDECLEAVRKNKWIGLKAKRTREGREVWERRGREIEIWERRIENGKVKSQKLFIYTTEQGIHATLGRSVHSTAIDLQVIQSLRRKKKRNLIHRILKWLLTMVTNAMLRHRVNDVSKMT